VATIPEPVQVVTEMVRLTRPGGWVAEREPDTEYAMRSMRSQIFEMGLATGAELDELDGEARRHLNDADTVAILGFLFLAWGRKPT
jgi:hypothetical protein